MGDFTAPFKVSTEPGAVTTLDLLIPELGLRYAWLLHKFGYKTAADIQKLTVKDIRAIPGFGATRTNKVVAAMKQFAEPRQSIGNVVYVDFPQMDLFGR